MPNNYIELYNNAKDYLVERAEPSLRAYYCNIWDPLSKFIIIREMTHLLKKEITEVFPDLPKHMKPQIKFKIFEDTMEIGVSVQNYLNKERHLTYIGSAEIHPIQYDMYYRESFYDSESMMFICRYGHLDNEYITGTKTAEAEYYMGAMTPLSIAYSVALDEGII